MLTNRSILTGLQQQMNTTRSEFVFNPPRLVQALIDAKLREKQLKQEVLRCKANEDRAR